MNIKKQLSSHRTVLENFTYISILQLFVLLVPLILYPYLIRVLGAELYGWVILAQVIVAYCSLLVDFGFNSVGARIIALNRDNSAKLGEIISSVLFVRFITWFLCFIVFFIIISLVPSYRQFRWLFIVTYGLTIQDLIFLQFYFQGVEKMKFITYASMAARILSLFLILLFVKETSDYILVPIFLSIGYLVGGVYSLYLILIKDRIKLVTPTREAIMFCIKDASLLLSTNLITTIKDKLNYILLASLVAVDQIVVYDLGSKLNTVLSKPSEILCTVLLPKFAVNKNIRKIKTILLWLVLIVSVCIVVLNVFLPEVVSFFLNNGDVDIMSIRIYTLAPIFLSVSLYLAFNVIIAFGKAKYMIYSIIVTTIVYLLLLGGFFFMGKLNTVTTFVVITVFSYLAEMLYRLWVSAKLFSKSSKS